MRPAFLPVLRVVFSKLRFGRYSEHDIELRGQLAEA
jgi:hypothetical protein